MELTDLKTEIHRLVDELPEDTYQEVLVFLKQKTRFSIFEPESRKHLEKIFEEDAELFRRLAAYDSGIELNKP